MTDDGRTISVRKKARVMSSGRSEADPSKKSQVKSSGESSLCCRQVVYLAPTRWDLFYILILKQQKASVPHTAMSAGFPSWADQSKVEWLLSAASLLFSSWPAPKIDVAACPLAAKASTFAIAEKVGQSVMVCGKQCKLVLSSIDWSGFVLRLTRTILGPTSY